MALRRKAKDLKQRAIVENILNGEIKISSAYADFVFTKDARDAVLIAGSGGVGKSFLSSRFFSSNNTIWEYGGHDSVVIFSYRGIQFVADDYAARGKRRKYDVIRWYAIPSDKPLRVRRTLLRPAVARIRKVILLNDGADNHSFQDVTDPACLTEWEHLGITKVMTFERENTVEEFNAIVQGLTQEFTIPIGITAPTDEMKQIDRGDEDVEWFSPLEWKYSDNERVRAIRILSRLSHPVLPRVRENKETGEWEAILLDGLRLQDWIDELSEVDDEQFLNAFLPKVLLVAEGLEFLHHAHIVHGNVSAHNIILHGVGMIPTLIDWEWIGPRWGYSNDNFAMPDLVRDALIRRLNLSGSILAFDKAADIFRKLEAACNAPGLYKPGFNSEILHLVEPRGLSNAEFMDELRHYMDKRRQSTHPPSTVDLDSIRSRIGA